LSVNSPELIFDLTLNLALTIALTLLTLTVTVSGNSNPTNPTYPTNPTNPTNPTTINSGELTDKNRFFCRFQTIYCPLVGAPSMNMPKSASDTDTNMSHVRDR